MSTAVAGANWTEARMLCPAGEYTSEDWHRHYEEHPDVLLQVLGDVFRVYKSEERKRNGTANPQGGRRKSQIDGSLEELWQIISPRYADRPFREAAKDLIGTRSIRAFAAKAGMTHVDLARKLRDDRYPPTRFDMERIANAGGVHPAYFVEWRTSVLQDLIARVFTASPHLSITLLKALTR